ncbi:Histidine protein methyltransferase 1, partial [Nowakowskiella sp. JEL0078]
LKPIIAEPVTFSSDFRLYRRNLSDVKFEIADNDELDLTEGTLATAIVAQSDLIPSVYEGGLKTWECASDLVEYLRNANIDFRGKKVLELGCGSGLPGLYCLLNEAEVKNAEVIQMVTIPNVMLNSPENALSKQASEMIDVDFEGSRAPENAHFWAGDWMHLKASWSALTEKFEAQGLAGQFDVVLTAETIYAEDTHAALHDMIDVALKRGGTAYVAAKTNYFGCSGSMHTFQTLVAGRGVFAMRRVFAHVDTVKREIVALSCQ